MKHTTLFAASVIAIASFAPQPSFATQPYAGATGNVAVNTTVTGNFTLGSNGSAVSYATNSEAATAKVTAGASYTPQYKTVNAGVSGTTTTESTGAAYNVSTGSGNGFALSAGATSAGVAGTVGIHGVTNGFNGGFSGTQSGNVIVAGRNEGSYLAGETASGFDTQVNYAKTSSWTPASTTGGTTSKGVSISGSTTGYAGGASLTGTIEGLNAAGIANIGASGSFFAKSGLSSSVGAAVAP